MKRAFGIAAAAFLAAVLTSPAFAQDTAIPATEARATIAPAAETTAMLTTAPAASVTIESYYKKELYNAGDKKMDEIGGFLGINEEYVAVSFDAVNHTEKDNDWRLAVDTTKDVLTEAPGHKDNRNSGEWEPDAD